jgi:hypothetical protein
MNLEAVPPTGTVLQGAQVSMDYNYQAEVADLEQTAALV